MESFVLEWMYVMCKRGVLVISNERGRSTTAYLPVALFWLIDGPGFGEGGGFMENEKWIVEEILELTKSW